MKRRNTIIALASTAILAVPIGYYTANSNSDPIENPVKKSNTFLVISDPHLRIDSTQNEVNGTNEADTGYDLWDITLTKFTEVISGKSNHPKPDYVVLLGDLPWHAFPGKPSEVVSARKNTGIVLSELRKAAQNANIPLIYAPGNNDSYSGDYRAFTAPNGDTPFVEDRQGKTDWPVINSGACDTEGTQACLADNTRADLGCYSVYPLGEKGGIRLIILNSVMFRYAGTNDHALTYYGKPGEQKRDINDQMAWFEKQFTEGNTDDAIMIGFHIPVGKDGFNGHEMWNTDITYNGMSVKDAFLDIMNDKKDRIVGVLTSHTHLDGLRKMMHKDTNGKFQYTDLIVSIPAIAPRNGNNPSMKLFTYDPDNNHEWLNFTTINHEYWPNKTIGSQWIEGDTISFNKAFKGDISVPISQRVAKMDSLSLLNAVTKIYKAGGNSANKNSVAITIEVTPDN